jgi:hypothetical protein
MYNGRTLEAKERTVHAACTYGWIYEWDERTGLLSTAERTVAILSTTELNEDSVLRKEEIKSTRGIELSALLIADASLWTGAAMTLMSEAALLASSRAASTVARSGALIWSDGFPCGGHPIRLILRSIHGDGRDRVRRLVGPVELLSATPINLRHLEDAIWAFLAHTSIAARKGPNEYSLAG